MKRIATILKKLIKWGIFFFTILLVIPLLLYLPHLYDNNLYKNIIIKNLETYTDYQLKLAKLDMNIYPYLRLDLQKIHLAYPRQKTQLLKLDEIEIKIHWLGFMEGGKLNIELIKIKDGWIDVPALVATFPTEKEKEQEKQESEQENGQLNSFLNENLDCQLLAIENIEVKIQKFHRQILHNVKITTLKFTYDSLTEMEADAIIEYGTTKLQLVAKAGIGPENFELASLQYEAELKIEKLPIREYAQYLKVIPGLEVGNSHLNLQLQAVKIKNESILKNNLQISISSLYYRDTEKKLTRIGNIQFHGGIDYPLGTKEITFRKTTLEIGRLFDIRIDSYLQFGYRPKIKIRAVTHRFYLDRLLTVINGLFPAEEEKEQPEKLEEKEQQAAKILLDLNYYIGMIQYEKYRIHRYFLQSRLLDDKLNFHTSLRNLADGTFSITGYVNLQDGVDINADAIIEKVDMKKLTETYFDKKLIEGELYSHLKIRSNNKTGEKDFMKNLYVSGSSQLKNGVLHDKADILYPVRFLTKIIPKNKQLNANLSGFKQIDIDYLVKNEVFRVINLDMQGSVFNVNGNVRVGMVKPEENFDLKLVVSASLAGAGLKIPLHYSKSNYVPLSIDKMWLASVYTGMVMGGPMGMLIGSALSEKAGKALSTIHNKSKQQIQKKTKQIFSP